MNPTCSANLLARPKISVWGMPCTSGGVSPTLRGFRSTDSDAPDEANPWPTRNFVTAYAQFTWGYKKHEGELLDYGEKPYAQHERYPYATFIPMGKGSRKLLSVTSLY